MGIPPIHWNEIYIYLKIESIASIDSSDFSCCVSINSKNASVIMLLDAANTQTSLNLRFVKICRVVGYIGVCTFEQYTKVRGTIVHAHQMKGRERE